MPLIILFHLSLEDLFDVFGRNAACVFVLIELAELNKDECTTFFLAQRL